MGVGGASVLNDVGILRVVLIVFIRFAYSDDPGDVCLWCIHNMRMS